MELLKVVEPDCRRTYMEASEEAEFFERLLSSRNGPNLGDDIMFLHQAYNEDMSAFSACEEQLDQLDPGYSECASSMADDITA